MSQSVKDIGTESVKQFIKNVGNDSVRANESI